MSRHFHPERQPSVDPEFLDPESGKNYYSIMQERLDSLTAREKEIADLGAEGLSDKEIATKLSISENTVKNTKQHAFLKLGINNNAMFGAMRHKLETYRHNSESADGAEDTRL